MPSYTYDARGNVINNGKIRSTYDHANQPTAMSGAGTTGVFSYDGNYKRVKQTINGETIYTVYGLSGAILYRDNASTGVATDYLRMGGKTVAQIKSTGEVSYLHQDHLGSPVAATDAAGNVLWRESYSPYGESLNAPQDNADNENFTGHIRDADTGLLYMQARYMDPVVGRFLSNDPVGFAQGGVDYFNRYAYTANDPVNFVDPDGRQYCRILCPGRIIPIPGIPIHSDQDRDGNGRQDDAEAAAKDLEEGFDDASENARNNSATTLCQNFPIQCAVVALAANILTSDEAAAGAAGEDVITGGSTPARGQRQVDNRGKGRSVTEVLEEAAEAAGVEVEQTGDGNPTVVLRNGNRATGYEESNSTGGPSIEIRTPRGRVKVKTREDAF